MRIFFGGCEGGGMGGGGGVWGWYELGGQDSHLDAKKGTTLQGLGQGARALGKGFMIKLRTYPCNNFPNFLQQHQSLRVNTRLRFRL